MSSKRDPRASADPSYSVGHQDAALAVMRLRTADKWAAHLLPHLTSGMRLLDCGCGPGSITVGLAEVVDPGEVVGIDLEASQVEMARAYAKEKGLTNCRFETADANELPFPGASFDAVHAHTLLMHVSDPVRVLCEFRRVLKPGGVIGVSDSLIDAWFVTGAERELCEEAFRLLQKATKAHGGDGNRGKFLGTLLREAGFERVVASAIYRTPETADERRQSYAVFAAMMTQTKLAEGIVALGLASRDRLIEIAEAWQGLAADPDALFAPAEGEAVGWK